MKRGPKGETGPAGPIGPQGNTGAKGDKGDTGDQGVQGVQGLKGDKGDKGDTGNTGATGTQGIQGVQGPAGPTGATGATGSTGATGPAGPGNVRAAQVTIPNIITLAVAAITVTWPTPFADTSYSVAVTVEGPTGILNILAVQAVRDKTVAGCVVDVKNISLALFNTANVKLNASAIHN